MHAFNVAPREYIRARSYPGHYVQFLVLPRYIQRVRKLLARTRTIEGWAHYCEQMMLDQGLGQPAPRQKMRARPAHPLDSSRIALRTPLHRRHSNAYRDNDLDQAETSFVQQVTIARNRRCRDEAGTSDPTYLYYTLGKLEY